MPGWDQFRKYVALYKGTASELQLEDYIARLGVPYRWQHPVGPYFLDFTLPRDKVVIEVDGESHTRPEQIAKDCERTAYLVARGWQVVRIWNDEVWRDPAGALNAAMERAGLPHRVPEVEGQRQANTGRHPAESSRATGWPATKYVTVVPSTSRRTKSARPSKPRTIKRKAASTGE